MQKYIIKKSKTISVVFPWEVINYFRDHYCHQKIFFIFVEFSWHYSFIKSQWYGSLLFIRFFSQIKVCSTTLFLPNTSVCETNISGTIKHSNGEQTFQNFKIYLTVLKATKLMNLKFCCQKHFYPIRVGRGRGDFKH